MDKVPSLAPAFRFVLCDPSHDGNIGMAARAIKTMGFRNLVIVNPRDPDYKTSEEAVAFATSSVDVLQEARTVATLTEALEGVTFAWALTGYDREFGPALEPLRAVSEKSMAWVSQGMGDVAFVFGTERTGLSNEQVMQCQGCAAIVANPESPSLNLSQAVQLTAYEMQMALLAHEGHANDLYDWQERFHHEPLAGLDAVEGFLKHFEEAMVSCGALDPNKPKTFMPVVRRLFGRTQLTVNEAVSYTHLTLPTICSV